MTDTVFITGSCQCGAVRFEVLEEPLGPWLCHCTECRKVSAGPMTATVAVRREAFALTSGALAQWERGSDSGAVNRAHFCPTCGNRIYHDNPAAPEILRLKTGAFDVEVQGEPLAHLYAGRAASWVRMAPDALVYDTQPTFAELLTALEEMRAG